MSYALPRTSPGPACFRTLTALASEPRSWQLQALFVEFPELFDDEYRVFRPILGAHLASSL